MSRRKDSDSSTSDSEVSACSSSFDPMKALYSSKTKLPVQNAPIYENVQQFESSKKHAEVLPIGMGQVVKKREQEKEKTRKQQEKELEEKNKQRFAKYKDAMVPTVKKKLRNVVTRMDNMKGPLAALKECVDKGHRIKRGKSLPCIRVNSEISTITCNVAGPKAVLEFPRASLAFTGSSVFTWLSVVDPGLQELQLKGRWDTPFSLSLVLKVITRSHTTSRGVLHATLIAFDKQWNLALADVLEIWKRKGVRKRKVPPGMGTPVPKGSAAKISPVPEVTETPLGKGVWECTRYIPQLFVRGEHVVIVNIVER